MILLRTGARALIWQSPESSAQGVLSDGVLETGTERTVYTMNFGCLWEELLTSPQVPDCCPVHIPSLYSKGLPETINSLGLSLLYGLTLTSVDDY